MKWILVILIALVSGCSFNSTSLSYGSLPHRGHHGSDFYGWRVHQGPFYKNEYKPIPPMDYNRID